MENALVNVPVIYEKIAQHFDETRTSHWTKVKEFILSLPRNSFLLDIGCGNGKYASVRKDIYYIGTDITLPLLYKSKFHTVSTEVFRSSCIDKLPIKPASMDAILHIAVLHHFATYEERLRILLSFFHYLSLSGRLIVTVWAYEQSNVKKRDVKWKRISSDTTDYLIPWLDKHTKVTYQRFYHLFPKEEICQLIDDILQIYSNYESILSFDCDNWVVEFRPKQICL
jgi:SAM-dependent methyltransferase